MRSSGLAIPLAVLCACSRPPTTPTPLAPAAPPPTAAGEADDPCSLATGPERPADCPPVPVAAADLPAGDVVIIDADGDGIDDVHDGCPQQAEDRDAVLDHDGCPEADGEDPMTGPLAPIQAERHPPRRF